MLSRLTEFALTQRLLVLIATLGLVVFGVRAFSRLPIDAFPDIAPTQVKIILKAPGMTPEEIESRVIGPIEMELLGIPRQVVLRAIAKYAIADITIDFAEGTDIYWARTQVSERLGGAMDALPDGVSGGLAPISTPLSDLFMFTIESDDLSLEQRRELLDWTIRPALRTVPGVADVNALGGYVRTYEVVPRTDAMAATGVTIERLRQVLEMNNSNDGAGRISEGEEALVVRSEGAVRDLQGLSHLVVAMRGDVPVRVGDIAEVRSGTLTRYGAVTRDGMGEAVQGIVVGLRGVNTRELLAGVRARLKELEPALPAGVELHVFYDRSDLILRAVGTVGKALIEAAVLVVLLLLVLLGEVRAAIVVALTLPLAALVTFIVMEQMGFSANLMSLGGLAIAIGMLVDAAVVVVENVVNRLAHDDGRMPRLHLIWRATREVATPVSSGIVIICMVFLPLLSLQGLEGKLFKPVAITIVIALLGSLLLALTVIPVLASFALRSGVHGEPWVVRRLTAIYGAVLRRALAHPGRVVSATGVALVVTVLAALTLGKTFMPTLDEGAILMQVAKIPSISLSRSSEDDLAIQRALLAQVPEIRHIVARAGSDELGFDPMGLNETDTFLELAPREQWRDDNKEALTERIRTVMAGFPGMDFSFTQPIEMRVSEMLTGSRGDVAVKIFGPDLGVLNDLAARMEALLGSLPGAADVYTVRNDGMKYLDAYLDPVAIGRADSSVRSVQDNLRVMLEGERVGTVNELNRRVPLVLRGAEATRASAERLSRVALAAADDAPVPLVALAGMERRSGPVKIDRENGSRYSLIQANVSGRDLVGFVEEAQARVAADLDLPTGYRIVWSGQFENQQRAAQRLLLVVPLALALIFLMLFSTLGSLRQALLIMANVPFALIGGVLALWVSGEYLSVPASVGFIALLGIVVLNGLVMVSYFNQLLAAGRSVEDTVWDGSMRRLRPVLMTAMIAAFGLVPLLFATGPGSEIQRPLAVVVIGGLFSATLLTLVLLPLMFRRFGVAVPAEVRT